MELSLLLNSCVHRAVNLWSPNSEGSGQSDLLHNYHGDASENQEQRVLCSALSTNISLEGAGVIVTSNWLPLNEQQLVCWTQLFGVC